MGRRAFFSDLEKVLAYHTNNENYRQKERAFQPERGRHLSQGQWQSFVKRICEILIEKKVEGKEEKKKVMGVKYRKVERKIDTVIPIVLQQNSKS